MDLGILQGGGGGRVLEKAGPWEFVCVRITFLKMGAYIMGSCKPYVLYYSNNNNIPRIGIHQVLHYM